MHLFHCLNPVEIKDQKGRTKYVPCGKCDYCRYVKSLGRTDRLTNELRKHKFCLFVTLTYHDAFLPIVHYNHSYHTLYFDSSNIEDSNFCDVVDGLCCNYNSTDIAELNLINKLTSVYGGVPVLNISDVQKFIKRLRIAVFRNKNLANKNKEIYEKEFKIVHAYCGEYGPSTYRPHYHLLFMFDNAQLAKALPQMLSSLWEIGIVSQRWISPDREDGHYIASYANAVARLPKIYQQKMVAPFYRTSRTGSFGFAKVSKEEVKRVYREESCTINIQDVLTNEFKSFPLPFYLKNKLYPKFSGFDALDVYGIVRLLRTAQLSPSLRDFQRELFYIHHRSNHSSLNDWLNMYLKGENLSFHLDVSSDKRIISNLARSIYYCSRAYSRLCNFFDVTLYEAVCNTKRFNDVYAQYQLKQQLEFEDTFYNEHPDWLYYIDSSPHSKEVYFATEFGSVLSFIEKQINSSHKNRRKREYLSQHPEYSYIDKFDDERLSFCNNIQV